MLKSRSINILFLLVTFIVIINDVFGEIPAWIYLIVFLCYVSFQAYGSIYLAAQFFVPVRLNSADNQKSIAITFDDGPIAGKTDKILDILSACQIKAAFFCIGSRVEENPMLAKRINNEGHLLGNHSYWHGKTFDLQFPAKISEELMKTDSAIEQSTGVKPRFFRPPYGVTNPMVAAAIREGKYITIGWSLRSFDTVIKDSSKLLDRVTMKLKPGDIVLFHDYSESMLNMLPDFIDRVGKAGLKVVRLDELINEKAYV